MILMVLFYEETIPKNAKKEDSLFKEDPL